MLTFHSPFFILVSLGYDIQEDQECFNEIVILPEVHNWLSKNNCFVHEPCFHHFHTMKVANDAKVTIPRSDTGCTTSHLTVPKNIPVNQRIPLLLKKLFECSKMAICFQKKNLVGRKSQSKPSVLRNNSRPIRNYYTDFQSQSLIRQKERILSLENQRDVAILKSRHILSSLQKIICQQKWI